jgi:hypothetical protein
LNPWGADDPIGRRAILPLLSTAVSRQVVLDIPAMGQVLDGTLIAQRFSALLLGVFAGIALLLAAVGIYSVLSYIVRRRSGQRTLVPA